MAGPNQSPQILVVDDDEGMLILMAEALRAENFTVTTADSGRAALAWLDAHTPDLMILDLKLQDLDGPVLVEKLRGRDTPVPFVVVTGQGDEKVAVEVMKQGALDYVMKDTGLIDLLPTVVRRALATVAQTQALVIAETEHRRLAREVVAAGERERRTIGADLHDGLGQQLTAIELMCSALKIDAAPYPAIARSLEQMSRMLREAVTQTRYLARGLVPVGSDPEALQMGLTELAEQMTASGRVRCVFECREPVALSDPQVVGQLYRIAQEAVNNATKHARAKQVTIRLSKSDKVLHLEISDNGIGLPKNLEANSGLGLGLMQHRAGAIGAELTIVSKRGEGVTIRCTLPLKK